jgi:hypothetical protein
VILFSRGICGGFTEGLDESTLDVDMNVADEHHSSDCRRRPATGFGGKSCYLSGASLLAEGQYTKWSVDFSMISYDLELE